MAVLAVAAVGAVAGAGVSLATAGAIGLGAAVGIGWAVGSVVGNTFFGPKPEGPEDQYSEGPRLNSLIARGGSYAADIPEAWGSVRMGTSVIWKLPLIEDKVTESTIIEGGGGGKGGKGGGGGSAISTNVSYEYYASFAVLVCEGPVTIGRIWLNSKLAHGGAGVSLLDEFMAVYTGTDTQLPDPAMEAAEGVGNVPGYRGTTYIVFDRLPLKDFGYSIPNVEVEVSKAPENFCAVQGTSTYLSIPPQLDEQKQFWAVEENSKDPASSYIIRTNGVREDAGGGNYRYYAGRRTKTTDGVLVEARVSSEYYGGGFGSAIASNVFEGGEYSLYNSNYYVYDAPNNVLTVLETTMPVGDRPAPYSTWRLPKAKIPNLELTDAFVYTSGYGNVLPDGVRVHVVTLVRNLEGHAVDYATVKIFTIDPGDVPLNGVLCRVLRDPYNRWWLTWAAGAVDRVFQAQLISFDIDNDKIVVNNTFEITSVDNLANYAIAEFGLGCVFFQNTTWELYSATLDFDTDTVSDHRLVANNAQNISHFYSTGAHILTTDAGAPYPAKILEGNFAGGVVGQANVGDIINELCLESGLDQSQVDVSAVTDTVVGYTRPGTMSLRNAVAPLLNAFMINAVESGGQIKFLSNTDDTTQTNITVIEDDMGAHPFGAGNEDTGDSVMVLRRVQEIEMPREVRVIYSDPQMDYDVNVHRAVNPVSTSQTQMDFEAPVVLNATAAKTIAYNYLNGSQTDRVSATFSLMPNHIAFEPGDILKVETHRGTLQLRLSRTALSPVGVLSCNAALFNSDSFINNPIADEGAGPAELPTVIASDVRLLDIPMLRTVDVDTTGIYAIGYPKYFSDVAWPGADLYHQLGGGWVLGTYWSVGKKATHGDVIDPLLDVAHPWSWDDTSELVVTSNLPLVASTDEDVQAGANQAAVGAHGRWEIVGFVNVEDLGSNQYKLTRLLRARRGTEQYTGTSVANDAFCLLDSIGVRRAALANEFTGTNTIWRMVAKNDRIQYSDDTPFISQNVGDTPFAPVELAGTRTPDLLISWTPRSRCAIEQNMGETYGVCEQEEKYQIEFRLAEGGAVLRMIEVVEAQSVVYSLQAYIADTGLAGATAIPDLYATIYQISAAVGRGYPGESVV